MIQFTNSDISKAVLAVLIFIGILMLLWISPLLELQLISNYEFSYFNSYSVMIPIYAYWLYPVFVKQKRNSAISLGIFYFFDMISFLKIQSKIIFFIFPLLLILGFFMFRGIREVLILHNEKNPDEENRKWDVKTILSISFTIILLSFITIFEFVFR
jgi:hypothetical protein